ncbi:MAG: type I-U CRISPR-associated protein Csb2 [Synechococcales bacterium]|nr:type I-U CRISPR-associated protein Csb2 [Synechococcales bacterium]
MTTTILIDLLCNTYGATAWNRAHIEADIELIPSPVRLLRAIISGAYKIDIGDSDVVQELITALSQSQPRYHIPQGTYIPYNSYRKDRANLVGELHKGGKLYAEPYYEYAEKEAYVAIQWDVALSDSQREVLAQCLENIAYLGRSEHGARWHLLEDDRDLTFNAEPRVGGEHLVLVPTVESVSELWVVPGERNSKLLTHPFVEVQYQVTWPERSRLRSGLPPVNHLEFVADISYDLDPRRTIDWCDALHKALCKACPESETFRFGTRIVLEGRRFQLDAAAFSDGEVEAAAGIRGLWRYDLKGIDVWLDRVALVERSIGDRWVSETPYFMVLAPATKARKSGTYATKRIAKGAFEKMGVEHQAIRELLLKADWTKDAVGELDWCDMGGGLLAAMRFGDAVATCRAVEWLERCDWHTVRRSGTQGEVLRPARGVAYYLEMTYVSGFAGVVSLGYGANFGLGVMR